MHVGHEEDSAVGRELDVLRHRAGAVGEVDGAHDLLAGDVDDDHLSRELAAREQLAPVGGEVHVVDTEAGHSERVVEPEGMRVSEVEPVQPLGDDDRVPAVWGEVHVVGVVDGDRSAGLAGPRVDRRQAVTDVVRDVEMAEVPGRHDVLGEPAHRRSARRSGTCAGRSRRRCRSGCSERRRAAWRSERPRSGGWRRRRRTRFPAGSRAPRAVPERVARRLPVGGARRGPPPCRSYRAPRPPESRRRAWPRRGRSVARRAFRPVLIRRVRGSTATIRLTGVSSSAPRPPIT